MCRHRQPCSTHSRHTAGSPGTRGSLQDVHSVAQYKLFTSTAEAATYLHSCELHPPYTLSGSHHPLRQSPCRCAAIYWHAPVCAAAQLAPSGPAGSAPLSPHPGWWHSRGGPACAARWPQTRGASPGTRSCPSAAAAAGRPSPEWAGRPTCSGRGPASSRGLGVTLPGRHELRTISFQKSMSNKDLHKHVWGITECCCETISGHVGAVMTLPVAWSKCKLRSIAACLAFLLPGPVGSGLPVCGPNSMSRPGAARQAQPACCPACLDGRPPGCSPTGRAQPRLGRLDRTGRCCCASPAGAIVDTKHPAADASTAFSECSTTWSGSLGGHLECRTSRSTVKQPAKLGPAAFHGTTY